MKRTQTKNIINQVFEGKKTYATIKEKNLI
jgi:hypothetical protein